MKNFVKFCCIILCLVLLSVMTVGCGNNENCGSSTNNSSTVPGSDSTTASGNSSTVSGPENNSSTNSTTNSSNQSSVANSSLNESGGSNSNLTSNTVSSGGESGTVNPNQNSPKIWLSAKATDKVVTVTANIKNNPGLTAFKFFVSYDESAVKPKILNQSDLKLDVISNLDQTTDLKGNISAVYISASGFKDNGELFSITFDLLETSKTHADFMIKHDNEAFLKLDAQTYADLLIEGITVKIR